MAKSTLVRTLVNNGKDVRFFNVDALTGPFFDRLLRIPSIKNLEVSDPDLEKNLTAEELKAIREKFPYLVPKVRKPEPLPLAETVLVNTEDVPEFVEVMEGMGATVKVSTPSDTPKPVEVILKDQNEPKPANAKRGRKPKTA
jgi:hypothetical protein